MKPAEARRQAGISTHSGWYMRVENNGWRAVSNSAVQELGGEVPYGPPLAGNAEGVAWHHSKLRRREELAQRRKTKKRQWLQKMYELGKKEEQGGGSDGAWRLLTEGVGPGGGDAGNGSAPKQPEDDDELDDGLEEMLKWSDSLDFESYYQGWLGLATSARPEWSGEAVAY